MSVCVVERHDEGDLEVGDGDCCGAGPRRPGLRRPKRVCIPSPYPEHPLFQESDDTERACELPRRRSLMTAAPCR